MAGATSHFLEGAGAMEEAPGAEEGRRSRAAAKMRSREDRDTAGASIPPSGLDAWAEEATANREGPGRPRRGGRPVTTRGRRRTRLARQVRRRERRRPGRERSRQRPCFRYGNYHRYYGYRVGESLEDHRIAHLKREWFPARGASTSGATRGWCRCPSRSRSDPPPCWASISTSGS